MSISCSCGDDYDFYYEVDEEEHISYKNKCCCYGCGDFLKKGSVVRGMREYEFNCEDDAEVEGDTHILCETCSGLYDSLTELGFCLESSPGFIKNAMNDYKNKDF